MKERTFYTINLDLRRIIILVSALVLLVVYSFILGHAFGKKKAEKELAEEAEISLLKDREPKKQKEIPPQKEPEESTPQEPIRQENEPVRELAEEEIPETPELPTGKPIKKKKEKPTGPPPNEKRMEIEDPDFYTLQLGAFSTKEQAQKFKEEVLGNYKKTKRLAPYIMKNGELYTVRMGRGLTKEEMEREKSKLAPEIKKDIILVKVKQN